MSTIGYYRYHLTCDNSKCVSKDMLIARLHTWVRSEEYTAPSGATARALSAADGWVIKHKTVLCPICIAAKMSIHKLKNGTVVINNNLGEIIPVHK